MSNGTGSRARFGETFWQISMPRSGSIATEIGCPRDVRFSADSDRIADIAGGPVRANRRHQSGVNAGLWEPHFLQHPR